MTSGRHELPRPLGDEVRRELARLPGGSGSSGELVELAARWPQAVGATIAANSWPARRARDGTVVVHASSSVWADELTRLAPAILERLGPAAPPALRFVAGPLPEPGPPEVTASQRSLPSPTEEERLLATEIAGGIEAPGLRAAVARAAALSLAATRVRRGDRRV